MQHRTEIVRLREAHRLSERQIARRLELPISTVHYWLSKEYAQKAPARRGRPRVTSSKDDEEIYVKSLNNPFTSAVDLRDELVPRISVDTVRKRLKERGLRCRVPAQKPFLKPFHVEKRLEFARRYQFWGVDDWARVVFSDEKIFRSSSTGQLRVYRPRKSNRFDQIYIQTGPSSRTTVCVWLAFGLNFKSIHRIEQRSLNADYYTSKILPIIKSYFEENREKDFIYQQDLSSIHTSKKTKHYLNENNLPWMDDWPPKGPDMNPVENVWGELVRRIRNNPTNREQLWENVLEAFQQLDTSYFTKLVESMPRRVEKVIAAQGHWTKY